MQNLDKHIRVSSKVKFMLDDNRGKQSCSAYIEDMLNYFEVTGVSPKLPVKNPTKKLEDRIEALIKIIRSYERDYFKPLVQGVPLDINTNDDFIQLANENVELKKQLKELSGLDSQDGIRLRYESLVDLVLSVLKIEKFELMPTGDLRIPKVMLETLVEKIKKEYVL